jgi:predicted RNA-binding Zn ribbon-like protein
MSQDVVMTSAGTAPEAAAVLLAFLNTRGHGTHRDRLSDAEDAGRALGDLLQSRAEVSESQLKRLRKLRSTVVDVVSAGHETADAAWASLNRQTSQISLGATFGAAGSATIRQTGGDPLIGTITIALERLMADGKWNRLRLCANERCGEAFYDSTRSNTQRWHSYGRCGNKSNVAAYRARTTASA